jgi:pimeloyl-ACP methyl ester carboxylesterase
MAGPTAALPDAMSAAALPEGIRSRFVEDVNGLRMHVLEAGFGGSRRPCVLLLHGFPELAYTWRKVMLPLAAARFHVIAPDQRGYGRTTGWDGSYDADLRPFRMLNVVIDALALVSALGHESVHAVVGHDFGSPVAAWCSLIRPDVFRSVALMSSPFGGPPALPFGTTDSPGVAAVPVASIDDALAALDPPRKHYQWYYSSREADDNMLRAPQGIHAFMRAYFHHKSAQCPGNKPFPLKEWAASELARMPTYYIMKKEQGMAQTVAPFMPSPQEIASCGWLTEDELRVYSSEFARTGFQGGLQWYRCETSGLNAADLKVFSGRTIDVPSCFIAGSSDWGVYQRPGALEAMQGRACTQMISCDLVDGAGHWVQQERPEEVAKLLLRFLR